MTDPSLEWMIDKDNPPEDNLPDVTMTSPTDPRTVRFVSTPAIAQPTPTTQPKNDDMIMLKTDMMDDLSLMGWTPENNDPPPLRS